MNDNPFLFHWLPIKRLERFAKSGVLKPYWRHWLPEDRSLIKGISFCFEPILWVPDDDQPREPCVIIEASSLSGDVRHVDSGRAYHDTREIKRLMRRGMTLEAAGEIVASHVRTIKSTPDEAFFLGELKWSSVVGIGFQEGDLPEDAGISRQIIALASEMQIPIVDMTTWEIGDPGIQETTEITSETIQFPRRPSP